MKYCQKCGAEMADTETTCPKCGAVQGAVTSGNTTPDIPSTGLNILCFFFPIVGLILYLVWKDTTPIRAKAIGKWALIGFIVGVVLGIAINACSMLALSSMY